MANITDLGFTLTELGEAVDRGEVRVQTHPEFPELNIANYTEEIQFKRKWSKITLACRGLIFNEATGEVLARPWRKFFNSNETLAAPIALEDEVEVTDKMDGSLGILYRRPDGDLAIATRGSFASEQAVHATKLLRERYPFDDLADEVIDSITFLFEIIYPENRIVCDYGDMDDLVLLGAVDNITGRYISPRAAKAIIAWKGPVTEVFPYYTYEDVLSAPPRAGKEGLVVRSGNHIVKLKQEDYVALHRIVTNLSPKTIWEQLSTGKTVQEICSHIPDEFHGYVKKHAHKIMANFYMRMHMAYMFFDIAVERLGDAERKEYAKEFANWKNTGLLFALLDGKPIESMVWKEVKPKKED